MKIMDKINLAVVSILTMVGAVVVVSFLVMVGTNMVRLVLRLPFLLTYEQSIVIGMGLCLFFVSVGIGLRAD